jgi:hypothetical protein
MPKTASTLIRQSYEKRGKRIGVLSVDDNTVNNTLNSLEKFHNCEFWPWDLPIEKHRELYKANLCRCFNCQVGWPSKRDNQKIEEHPIYSWQREIFDSLDNPTDDPNRKLTAILKGRSVGGSELALRIIFWKIVSSPEKMSGTNVILCTGIRE